jgi:hypothetical protein
MTRESASGQRPDAGTVQARQGQCREHYEGDPVVPGRAEQACAVYREEPGAHGGHAHAQVGDVDILPGLKAVDSNYAERSVSWGSRFTGPVFRSPRRALTACPAAMFLAAFTSALAAYPQAVHRKRAWL